MKPASRNWMRIRRPSRAKAGAAKMPKAAERVRRISAFAVISLSCRACWTGFGERLKPDQAKVKHTMAERAPFTFVQGTRSELLFDRIFQTAKCFYLV
jgi:hypothetical protein